MDDTHSFWYSIDEDDEDKLIKDFGDLPSERLIDELHGLTKTCSGIVNASFVNSETAESYSKELNECKDLQRDYKSNWEIADDNKKEAETELENCKTSLEEKRIQVDSLNNQVNQLQREETNYNQCFQDLENEKKSKQNSAILWLAIGVGLGYVLWNKKTQVGPSEQSESGVYTDLPEYRDY
jgi:DNA repair exonuclease SbcCD ATPase subunit